MDRELEHDPTRPLVVGSDVVARLPASVALEAAHTAAVCQLATDTTLGRLNVAIPGGGMRILAAVLPSLGVLGHKQFHETANGAVRYAIHLFSVDDGRPLGIVDAALVTPMRTAATAAVAAGACRDVHGPVAVGVIGSGMEARSGLEMLAATFDVRAARVTSRNPENRDAFARTMQESLDLPVEAVDSTRAAADGADVVYVATNSRGAVVVDRAALTGVPLVLSIGSTVPAQRELAGDVLLGADRVVIDTPEVLEESGDALEAIELGFDVRGVERLGDVLASGVGPPGAQTLYKSIGSPEQDVVLALAILERARAEGLGTSIPALSMVKWLHPGP